MKRKGHLAVFENVLESRTSKDMDDLSVGSSDLLDDDKYIDEIPCRKKRAKDLDQEIVHMTCRWDECFLIFQDYHKFDSHLRNHCSDVDQENYPCRVSNCDFTASNYQSALQHISYHGYQEFVYSVGDTVAYDENLPDCKIDFSHKFPEPRECFTCQWEDCIFAFMTVYDFLLHIKQHVNGCPTRAKTPGSLQCGWTGCKFTYTKLFQLVKHVPVHTDEKKIGCRSCGKMFFHRYRFCEHRLRQTAVEKLNYKCSQCSKLFSTEALLRDHVRQHINNYKCSMCDMTCTRPAALARHIRHRHMNERPYKCNLCEYASCSKQNLETHLITHCSEKLMACDECSFRCRSMASLDKHINDVHGQNYLKTYECHVCRKQYNRGDFLTKHLMSVHDFKWPSGHSRFRYKEDSDGKFRVQTLRYESLDVIKEIIDSKNKTEIVEMKCTLHKTECLEETAAATFEVQLVDQKLIKIEK